MQPENSSPPEDTFVRRDRSGMYYFAACVVSIAAVWYMLKELDVLFRPLFTAVLLAYVILPLRNHLRKYVSGTVANIILAIGTAALMIGFTQVLVVNARQLSGELPRLKVRAESIINNVEHFIQEKVPWLKRAMSSDSHTSVVSEQGQALAAALLAKAAGAMGEALVVVLYLTFLLVEAGRFPKRVAGTFSTERATAIGSTVTAINTSIGRYLRAKVQSSLLLGAPITIVLMLFDVNFAGLWGLLAFLFNFIPYIGSVLGFALPVGFAYLDLASPGTATVVMVLVGVCYVASASFIEPQLLGKAVGLPPIMILMALTFWGLCWGIGGMLLAVPLTVMLKIIMEHVEATRPVARLLSDD